MVATSSSTARTSTDRGAITHTALSDNVNETDDSRDNGKGQGRSLKRARARKSRQGTIAVLNTIKGVKDPTGGNVHQSVAWKRDTERIGEQKLPCSVQNGFANFRYPSCSLFCREKKDLRGHGGTEGLDATALALAIVNVSCRSHGHWILYSLFILFVRVSFMFDSDGLKES